MTNESDGGAMIRRALEGVARMARVAFGCGDVCVMGGALLELSAAELGAGVDVSSPTDAELAGPRTLASPSPSEPAPGELPEEIREAIDAVEKYAQEWGRAAALSHAIVMHAPSKRALLESAILRWRPAPAGGDALRALKALVMAAPDPDFVRTAALEDDSDPASMIEEGARVYREALERARSLLAAPPATPEPAPRCAHPPGDLCRLCSFGPICAKHPDAPLRRFGDLFRCSECGEPGTLMLRPAADGGGGNG